MGCRDAFRRPTRTLSSFPPTCARLKQKWCKACVAESLGPADIRCGNGCGRLHGQTSRTAARHFGRRYLVAGREEVESDQGFVLYGQRLSLPKIRNLTADLSVVLDLERRHQGSDFLCTCILADKCWSSRLRPSRKKIPIWPQRFFMFNLAWSSSPCFPLPFLACVTIRSILTLACFINPRSTLQSARPVSTQLAHHRWRSGDRDVSMASMEEATHKARINSWLHVVISGTKKWTLIKYIEMYKG